MPPMDMSERHCQNCNFHHVVPDFTHCVNCGQVRRGPMLQQTTGMSTFDVPEDAPQKDAKEKEEEESSEDSLIAHLQKTQSQSQLQRATDNDTKKEEEPSPSGSSPTNLPQHANDQDGGPSSYEPKQSSNSHFPQHNVEQQQQQQQLQPQPQLELKGDETFLVGMTPQFWAHVPMLIDDIRNNLTLSKGGINLLQQIPVSKCLLVGRIIWANQMSDNTMAYVLDDGTGLMDCICYHNHNDSVYELPSLLPSPASSSLEQDNISTTQQNFDGDSFYNPKRPIPLGTCVKIFGKIKNLAISHGRVVREVNAQLVEPVYESFNNSNTGSSGGGNPEHEHWAKCANFFQAMSGGGVGSSSDASSTNTTCPILPSLGCLQLLGDRIQSQVRAKQRLPSADDTLGAWRVFGTQCQCTCCQSIKDSLLYCHCQAKIVDEDQQFQFRDALLKYLLQCQTKHVKKLVFAYQDIKQEESLLQVAMEQAAKSNNATNNNNGGGGGGKKKTRFYQEELIRSTVRALVKDGIIYHIDPDNDEYLLITREKVLEPYVRDELEWTGNTKNFVSLKGAPDYLLGVDLEKFLYIKRCVVHENTINNQKKKGRKIKKTNKLADDTANEAKRQKIVGN